MILLDQYEGIVYLIIGLYLLAHSPAIIMLIMGLYIRKKRPTTGKVLLILSGVYFLIGGGICASLLS